MSNLKDLLILHISPSYKPAYCYGGPIMSVAKLCEELYKAGLKTQVLTTLANGDCELHLRSGCQKVVDGVRVTYYKRITKDHTHFSPALLLAMHTIIKEARRTDEKLVIHVHSWWNLVALFATALAIFHKVPVIVSPRGMITNYTLSFRNTFTKYIIHNTIGRYLLRRSHVHATSVQEAANIREHLVRANLFIIPNLVELPPSGTCKNRKMVNHRIIFFKHNETLETQIFKPLPCLNILFLSRIDKKKGLELLFSVLPSLNFNWKLSIAGSGDQKYIRHLKQLSVNSMISSRISWLGQVTNEQKYSTLARHDVTVLLSSNENFANVVVESLAVGTPVLVSNLVGLSTYIQESNLGYVCGRQVSDVLQTFNFINKDVVHRYQIRKHAPAKIEADFSASEIIKDYIQLYGTVAIKR